MILTLILGAAAGFAARPLEPQVTEWLVKRMGEDKLPDAADRRVAALLICLLVGAIVSVLGGDDGVVVFVIGAALGYFQQQIRDAVTNRQG